MSRLRYHLCLVTDSFACGGSEHQFVEVVTRLDRSKYEVEIGCLRREGPFYQRVAASGLPVSEFPIRAWLSGQTFRSSLRWLERLRQARFDLVHSFDLYSNLFAAPLARLARAPVVVTSLRQHPSLGTALQRRVLFRVFGWSDCVMTNSEAGREGLLRAGIPPARIRVVYNGVDVERFSPNGHSQERRQQLGLPAEALLVGVVGNLRAEKDHHTLLAAAPEIIRQLPQTQFLLIGSGPLERELQSEAAARQLTRHVHFLGQRSDVPELLSAVDLVVLPTRWESLPNSVLEAMSAGRSVIASDVGGCCELIEPERTGLLVPPQDPQALAEKIVWLLGEPQRREVLGQAARQRAEADFDIRAVVKRFEAIYDELLEQKRARGSAQTR